MQQLQCEYEETQKERDKQSFAVSDMSLEINHLKKVQWSKMVNHP